MTTHRCPITAVALVLVAGAAAFALLALVGPSRAYAACPLRENLDKARADWEAALKAADTVKPDPALAAQFGVVLSLDGLGLEISAENWLKGLPDAEQAALHDYIKKSKEARAKVDAARAALDQASKAWRDELAKKEEALTKADTRFREDHSWLDHEKEALSKLEVNSPEYLDRASKIAERLKKSYADFNSELGPFRDCFDDVRGFLSDIDRRSARVAALEAEIARRRGGAVARSGPADPPVNPDAPTWTCTGPEVKVIRDTQNLLTAKGPDTVSFRVVDDQGRSGTATVSITKGPKLKLAVGERVELIMTATVQAPAWANAGWNPGDFGGGKSFEDHGLYIATVENKFKAVWHALFIGHDPRGAPCYMRATIGRNIGNAVYDPQVDITWTYTMDSPPKK